MKCFDCGENILKDDVKFIPLDVPYVNLPFHRSSCLLNVIADGEEEYLRKNLGKILDYMDGMDVGRLKTALKSKRKKK
jgi:hypothetical protein